MNQWRKDIAAWTCGKTLYLSIPFTWLLPKAEEMANGYKGKVIAGGPAVDLAQSDMPNTPGPIEWAETPKECPFDTLSMHNPCATFTSRGCPNQCEFCAVPKIEGHFREFETWKPAPVVCDNNILASTNRHFEAVIDSLLPFPWVDFNQGLDARLFTPWHAGQLARLQGVMVRFALDHSALYGKVFDAINIARKAGLREFRVYVLFGWHDSPADARARLEMVRSWGIWPNAMRYQPLNALRRNSFVAAGWTARELKRMSRYYNRLAWLGGVDYADYEPEDELPLFPEFAREMA